MRKLFPAGYIVSEGTLRDCDLLRNFSAALKSLLPGNRLVKQVEKFLDAHGDYYNDPKVSCEAQILLLMLENELEYRAPETCYFASHEGDGACFGFWSYTELELQ